MGNYKALIDICGLDPDKDEKIINAVLQGEKK